MKCDKDSEVEIVDKPKWSVSRPVDRGCYKVFRVFYEIPPGPPSPEQVESALAEYNISGP